MFMSQCKMHYGPICPFVHVECVLHVCVCVDVFVDV